VQALIPITDQKTLSDLLAVKLKRNGKVQNPFSSSAAAVFVFVGLTDRTEVTKCTDCFGRIDPFSFLLKKLRRKLITAAERERKKQIDRERE
jgi:hypothetical protein